MLFLAESEAVLFKVADLSWYIWNWIFTCNHHKQLHAFASFFTSLPTGYSQASCVLLYTRACPCLSVFVHSGAPMFVLFYILARQCFVCCSPFWRALVCLTQLLELCRDGGIWWQPLPSAFSGLLSIPCHSLPFKAAMRPLWCI